jgi:hypothetical protein
MQFWDLDPYPNLTWAGSGVEKCAIQKYRIGFLLIFHSDLSDISYRFHVVLKFISDKRTERISLLYADLMLTRRGPNKIVYLNVFILVR